MLTFRFFSQTFIAQNNALGEEYNDLLKQKSNWQSKIDELKTIRRTQQEYDDEIEALRIEIEKLRTQLKVSADKVCVGKLIVWRIFLIQFF